MATRSNSSSALASSGGNRLRSGSNEPSVTVNRDTGVLKNNLTPGFGTGTRQIKRQSPLGTERALDPASRAIEVETCSQEPRVDPPRRRSEPVSESVTKIDFVELADGSLVELVEDPNNSLRTLLAVWKDARVELTDKLVHRGQVFLPLPRNEGILRRVRLPDGARPYESVPALLSCLEGLISRCVAVDERYVAVLANFVLSTWLVDRFPVAPYLSIVGLPQSGKTTLLRILSLVCRRSLLVADVTSAAFYQACGQLTPTLLIDEAGTAGNSRILRHMLRMGTTRDVVAMRKNQSFHAYGAKVICWLEPPDDMGLNSRCILIPMTECNNPNLIKPTDVSLERDAAGLQAQLLQFRFDHYKGLQPVEIPGEEELRPRTRDLLHCLAASCAEDEARCNSLLGFFKWQVQATKEPLSPPQGAVLAALFFLIHQRLGTELCVVGDLTKMVNALLEQAGERARLHARKVGAVLTSLGVTTRQRTNVGWTVWLNRSEQERVHELVQVHGIERFSLRLPIPPEQCPLCESIAVYEFSPSKASAPRTASEFHLVDNMGFCDSGNGNG